MKVALLFDNFGPYHWARARAVAGVCDLLTIEFGKSSRTYAWSNHQCLDSTHLTLNPDGTSSEISRSTLRERMWGALDQFKPDAVMVPGWSSREALLALNWCCRTGTPAVLMSESTVDDSPRSLVGEAPKRRLMRFYSAALVGGTPHRDYATQLGMASDRVFIGYNAVDNGYFAEKTRDYKTQDAREVECGERRQGAGVRSQKSGAEKSFKIQNLKFKIYPPPCFLASNRFIERKNLLRLIEAYAVYVQRASSPATDNGQRTTPPWHLCVLGDGEQKPALIAQCEALNLQVIESAPWEATGKAESRKQNPAERDGQELFATCPEGVPPAGGIKAEMAEADANSAFLLSEFQLSAFPPRPNVYFPGFRQIEELPRFYAHAGCFIHPALSEPWGLVVNEAMAGGLPVLVSERVGCAQDLVQEGVNGFTFDPENVEQISDLLCTVAATDFPRDAYGAASRRIVDKFSPDAFAAGLDAAARKAMEVEPTRPSLLDRMLLEVLCRVR